MKNIFITGANGFVGKALLKNLVADGLTVKGAIRPGRAPKSIEGVSFFEIDTIDGYTDWKRAFQGCDAIVHTAARVHIVRDRAIDPLEAYRRVNVDGTVNLARQAAASGVGRFIYLSSIKVNGEENSARYKETDNPAPLDAYGISKMEAENHLRECAIKTGMEVVIIRPPLVYGPGVRANFLKLLTMIDSSLPLPLASVDNRRSMIYIGNLVDAIRLCLRHSKAADQTYIVSDGEDLSTPELVHKIAAGLESKTRLIPIPPKFLVLLARTVQGTQVVDRLVGSLTVNDSKIKRELGWYPPFTVDDGIDSTITWFKQEYKSTR